MVPPVVDVRWLRDRLDDDPDGTVVADVRWYLDGRSGRKAYEAGHLPGAIFVDLDQLLAGAPSPAAGRHPLPDPAVFADGLGALGVGDADVVIAYDDVGGSIAARLVWLLRIVGHAAAVLDGGLGAWDEDLQRQVIPRGARTLSAHEWPVERLASLADICRVSADGAGVTIDARDPARYRGDEEPVDPRSGHIPGARSAPWRDNLDSHGRFLPVAELNSRYAALGVGPEPGVVMAYCGSGVTACHDLLAIELAGLGQGRLYAGSWSQWSAEPTLPVELGNSGNSGTRGPGGLKDVDRPLILDHGKDRADPVAP